MNRPRKDPARRKRPAVATPDSAELRQTYAAAVLHHQAGRLQQAMALYRQVQALDPRHADSLHLLGVAASQTGNHAQALELIGQAIAIIPNRPVYHTNLGKVLRDLGRPQDALACCRRAVALDETSADAHARLADTLQLLGQGEAAIASYRHALSLAPDLAEVQISLGNLLFSRDELDAAESCYRAALDLEPENADALNNIGTVLYRRGQLEDATAFCRRALALNPRYEPAYVNLGDICRQQRRSADAADCYQQAIALKPDRPDSHNKLGAARLDLQQVVEAIGSFRTATRLAPEYAEPYSNLGFAYARLGELDKAIECCRTALRLSPNFAEAHNNLAMALLASGDLAAGWPEYEWRWQVPPALQTRRDFAQPQWRGEAGEGRTLLIHGEQGAGDMLQFCRYVPLAKARGWRVIVEVPATLLRLLSSVRGVDVLAVTGSPLPSFDVHCPMLSLPLALGTTLETIPGQTPYLAADPARVAAWRARLAPADAAGPRIGLAWAGNPRRDWWIGAAIDRQRSIAPQRLAPLLALPGLQFFSLQKDGPAMPGNLPLVNHMDEMRDYANTAALVANLDLVISVDTSVVHLAGALGRPVWLLDRFDHCWRWLTGRRDSPWYPLLRIYRQPLPDDWDAVLAEVAGDLRLLAPAWQSAWDAAHAALPTA